MYKQPLPTLCFPSLSRRSAWLSSPDITYSVRFCLRGEKAIKGQSTSWPLAYLIFRAPKPTMLVPHITGLLPVAVSIKFAIVEQSARIAGSGRFAIKPLTLCLVGLVFASAIFRLSCNEIAYCLLARHDRQFNEARPTRCVINPLRRFLKVLWLGPENIRDERLRVAIVKRK